MRMSCPKVTGLLGGCPVSPQGMGQLRDVGWHLLVQRSSLGWLCWSWGVQWGWSSWLLLLPGHLDTLSREFPRK